ncbi:ATP-dependent acyl-CoA ligase [Yinghuangia aomiensis]|uniref:ATP-dependent acyl-CoA ligase n=1 Tax=Yinghuangia aomiensis TaxID=676205 RepID=A0ABP9HU27_9ACTN
MTVGTENRGVEVEPPPREGRDLAWLVDARAASAPDKTVLVWVPFHGPRRQWTAREFSEATQACAAGLAARGVRGGQSVLIHLDNCPEFLIAWLACARLGAKAVTSNTRLACEELRHIVTGSRAITVITQPRYLGTVMSAAPHAGLVVSTASDQGKEPESVPPRAVVPFEALLGDGRQGGHGRISPWTPCSVQYTSGTTARPKGVVWTHANALWAAQSGARVLGLHESDVQPIYLPLFHTNALALSYLPMLWAGGTTILLPRFSASRFWDIAAEFRCTTASVTAFVLRALGSGPDPVEHHFRLWAAGAGDQPVAARWGIRLIGWYGSTETVAVCIAGDHARPGAEGAMGTRVDGYDLAVRHADGSAARPGESGRLWVRARPGAGLFQGYLDDPEATAAAFEDGWYDTGDEVTESPDGQFFFRGRAKDMLKVGGENVAAVEIESVISKVDGVDECAVVGAPDVMLDEVPVAFVVSRRPGPRLTAEIHRACDHALADFKRPRDVRFVDDLPKSTLGKVRKSELRLVLKKEVAE